MRSFGLRTTKGDDVAEYWQTWREGFRYEPAPRCSSSADTETRLLIEGRVRHGDQRGRTLGFPTANVPVSSDSIQPPQGVFAGYVHVDSGSWFGAAVSVGTRETFYASGQLLVEAHLLDFDSDLYGALVVVELVSRLREQVRFDGIDQLRQQLRRDVEDTRALLASCRPRLSSLAA